MIIFVLFVFGVILGSFVNALVWRVHEQSKSKTKSNKLSVIRGRSICPNCKHQLSSLDLIPVVSWLMLRGKCRYCKKPISVQYPVVELALGLLFVGSYIFWPNDFDRTAISQFVLWLGLLTGFLALTVYDMKWYLLPNRIIYPLTGFGLVYALIGIISSTNPQLALLDVIFGVLIGGGVFYILFQLSGGKWIGGGDVRLGWLLGLVIGNAQGAVLMIFLASLLGSIVSIPLMLTKKSNRHTLVPFGPFLIAAAIIVVLWGEKVIDWYSKTFLISA